MRFPWQKVSQEEIDRAFADKSIPGQYDDQYVLLQKVNKVYGNKFHAVHDFSLCIKKKEFVVFVGPSGCGKSTTLRMIAGLEDISAGHLFINGEYANNLLAKDRDIAMVFQNYALYPNMTVFGNMAFALKVRRFSKDLIKQRVEEAAKTLEISDQLKKKPKELSGGQRQRVALGRAIVRNARIFLMDEPLSNLDAKLRVQMRSEIIDLHRKLKATTIYVTHDQTEAMTMADRIVVMKDGYIQQIGTPMEIYRHPRNLFVASFIGSPAMNLIHGIYEKGVITFP
ncbi:MAG: ATP-binding cassette domain-containing protein, partial [Bacilli bacterium]|nr:ATP-binding cassette domain-containing protein [Bacilli bacterium]